MLTIDASKPAKHAQSIAIDLVSKYEAKLIVVHVLTHDQPSSELAGMAEVEIQA